jgi:hypothetical protein
MGGVAEEPMAGVFQRGLVTQIVGSAAVALTALTGAACAADNQPPAGQSPGKVVIQSKGPGVPVSGTVAQLHLSDAQRARIAEVLATKDTEVDLKLKAHKDSKSFEAKVDAKLPKDLKAEAFPQPLITEIPATRGYAYLKFKGEILIVNELTGKIVDKFPEKSG